MRSAGQAVAPVGAVLPPECTHEEQLAQLEQRLRGMWRHSLVSCDAQVAALSNTLRARNSELRFLKDKVDELNGQIDALTRFDLPLDVLEDLVVGATSALHSRFKTRIEEVTNCAVCMQRPKTTMLLPCNHVCLCSECASLALEIIKVCPICRGSISSTTTVYT
jgi:hypothetical protein